MSTTPNVVWDEPAHNIQWDETPKRTVMDSAKDFASEFWKQVNPIAGIKGAAEITAHPVETFKNDANARQQVYNEAEAAFKKGNHAEGAAKLLYSFIPMMGPQLNEAANSFLGGQTAKGLGASTGMGVALAGPKIIENIRNAHPIQSITPSNVPEKLYKSALKPSTTIPIEKQALLVKTGLENKIPITASGLEKISNLIDEYNSQIKSTIDTGNQAGKTINKFKIASRLGDTVKQFSNQVTPLSDLANISESGNEFLSTQPTEIGASQAQSLKQGTYKQLKNRAYGELKSATVESQKSLARGIKEELVNQFPELKDLNAKESQLLQLEPVLERAINRISNHQIIGIGTPIAAGAAKAVTGSTGIGAITGFLKAVIDDPMIKSKLAIALSKSSKAGQSSAWDRIAAYSNALGNAANSEKSDGQEGQ